MLFSTVSVWSVFLLIFNAASTSVIQPGQFEVPVFGKRSVWVKLTQPKVLKTVNDSIHCMTCIFYFILEVDLTIDIMIMYDRLYKK